MFDFVVAGVVAPIFLLVFVGFTVGIVGGFIGVGGGYMVTPALIVFGFPGYMASGIDMTHIAGKGLVSTIRHRQLGNIDWTMALSMVAGTMLGVELGVRLLVYFKKLGISGVVLLITSVVVMFSLFLYTQIETRRAHRKAEQMTRDGQKIVRRDPDLEPPLVLPEDPALPDRPLPDRPGRRLDVGDRRGRRRHRLPRRLPRRRRRVHPGPGPGLPGRRLDPHRGRHRPRRDRLLRRLRGAPSLDGGPRGHDGGAVHDRRGHVRRPVRIHRHRRTCAARRSATSCRTR